MEIIEELEPSVRSVYAGAILYLDFSGNLDSCISIRTLVVKEGKAYVQAGAGIVADPFRRGSFRKPSTRPRPSSRLLSWREEGCRGNPCGCPVFLERGSVNQEKSGSAMILVIDNYDSFTYNLVQYLGELGEEIVVYRNDRIDVSGVESSKPQKIVISPGPGVPDNAGVTLELIDALRE